MTVWAVVVAAGSGSRFGGPKQYEPLGNGRVLDLSLVTARAACDGVVVVVPPDRADDPEPEADAVVAGGATRSASVRAGLAAVPADAATIVVHDAARPLASGALWAAVLEALRSGPDGVVPAVPVTDTIRRLHGGAVDRAELVAVQTPQAFRAESLRRAHDRETEGTDDASLVEAVGGKVVVVDGEPENLKITTSVDLALAELLIR